MPDKQSRTLHVELDRADAKSRTFPASLSSEEPVERGFGWEILDHSPSAIDFSRARDGLPLLFQHDPARPLGMIENIRAEGARLRAEVKFFQTDEGAEAAQMVREGLRTLSVGYMVNEMKQDGEREGVPLYRVTKWTPLEASLVTIPADRTVGIGRASTNFQKGPRIMEQHENNQARAAAIVELGEQFSKFVTQRDVAEAVRNGRTVEQFKDDILRKMESGSTDVSQRYIGMTARDVGRYSLARALVASVTGDWRGAGFEREASHACAQLYGRSPEGFYVPLDYFRRDFNVGTSTEAGNLVATDLRGDLYTDALRNAMVLTRLGVRILPGLTGNVAIPRKATASTLGMLAEIGSASETAPVTAQPSLSPKRVGAYVEVSKQALIQSAIALEAMLRDDLVMGAAALIENQVLNGVGSNNEMTGVRNTASIGTVTAGTNGAALAWSHLVDLEAACANSNAEPGSLAGYIINAKTRAKAKQTARGTNLDFILPPDAVIDGSGFPRLNGYRAGVTNSLPSNLTKGTSTTICSAALFSSDWSMQVLGLFGGPDLVVDPYSKADSGQVKITLNQYADTASRQPAAFAKVEDLLTT